MNNVFDFEKFKQQQAEAIKNFNDQLPVKKNKNLKIATKKISGKYRKLRNSRAAAAAQKTQTKEELPVKKRQTDKAALITAKKIVYKYKNIRFS